MQVRGNRLLPRMVFFTRREVEAGEELTFDYGATDMPQAGKDDRQDRRACRCGAVCCRGVLPYDSAVLGPS